MSIRVLVNGSHGRMGQVTLKAIENHPQLTLAGESNSEDDLTQKIQETHGEVVVDFTTPEVVYANCQKIIEAGAHPVIGTSGLDNEQITHLQTLCEEKSLGGIIAPNFSLGAVLMMKYAQEFVKYLPQVEIIELHHDKKADAPSGTAVKTATLLAEARGKPSKEITCEELMPGALGANYEGIPIHSVRLPGLVAHQEIIFGGHHETVHIRHDSLNRESFMPGVCLACEKVVNLKKLIYGLEHLL